MPPILRKAPDTRPSLGSGILECIRRYGGSLNPSQIEIVRAVLAGDLGDVPPGVTPVPPPVPLPVDPSQIFNDGVDILPVTNQNLSGIENFAARVDHQHEGVHSNAKRGGTPLLGDVTFSVEGLLTLAQQANDLHFTLTLADIVQYQVHERYQLVHNTGYTFTLLYRPLGEVLTFFAGKRKHRNLHYSQGLQSITFVNDVTFVDGDLIQFSYWRSLDSTS